PLPLSSNSIPVHDAGLHHFIQTDPNILMQHFLGLVFAITAIGERSGVIRRNEYQALILIAAQVPKYLSPIAHLGLMWYFQSNLFQQVGRISKPMDVVVPFSGGVKHRHSAVIGAKALADVI